MSELPPEPGLERSATLIVAARERLEPRLETLINALAADGDTSAFFAAGAFVQNLLERLRVVGTEAELLRLMLDVSLIEFQGFTFTGPATGAVAALLSDCEALALRMTDASH